MVALNLETRLRDEFKEQWWLTSDRQYRELGDLLDMTMAIIDRLAAGDYSGTITNQ